MALHKTQRVFIASGARCYVASAIFELIIRIPQKKTPARIPFLLVEMGSDGHLLRADTKEVVTRPQVPTARRVFEQLAA